MNRRIDRTMYALRGLLESLPDRDKGWTKEQRNGFLEVFTKALDYYVPVKEDCRNE